MVERLIDLWYSLLKPPVVHVPPIVSNESIHYRAFVIRLIHRALSAAHLALELGSDAQSAQSLLFTGVGLYAYGDMFDPFSSFTHANHALFTDIWLSSHGTITFRRLVLGSLAAKEELPALSETKTNMMDAIVGEQNCWFFPSLHTCCDLQRERNICLALRLCWILTEKMPQLSTSSLWPQSCDVSLSDGKKEKEKVCASIMTNATFLDTIQKEEPLGPTSHAFLKALRTQHKEEEQAKKDTSFYGKLRQKEDTSSLFLSKCQGLFELTFTLF